MTNPPKKPLTALLKSFIRMENVLVTPATDSAPKESASPLPSTRHLWYSYGYATLKGKFHANEDRVSVTASPTTSDAPPSCLVLLCDGHDGSACAAFIQSHFSRSLPTRGATGLAEAFADIESAWTQHVRSAIAHGARLSSGISSGACLTAVYIRGTQVVAANVGDARAVLRRADGSVTILTEDHRLCNPAERERVLRVGGPKAIRNGRVVGVLEPTRTIGDLQEKAAARPDTISPVPTVTETELGPGDVGQPAKALIANSVSISPVSGAHAAHQRGALASSASLPSSLVGRTATAAGLMKRGFNAALSGALTLTGMERGPASGGQASVRARLRSTAYAPLTVSEASLTARVSRVSFIIAASDGVWDVLTSTAAAAIVAHVLETRSDAGAAASELVALAQRMGSADDITAAVVWLHERASDSSSEDA